MSADGDVVANAVFKANSDQLIRTSHYFTGRALFSDAGTTFDSLQKGAHYEITDVTNLDTNAKKQEIVDNSDLTSIDQVVNGVTFTATSSLAKASMTGSFVGEMLTGTGALTRKIEAVQAKINTARVQAGSQYAALESAVAYTTDLTAQYELGFNTVNDVNFSMETAHLAKNQILQQAATAMLAQANSGQQSLLQLIQG